MSVASNGSGAPVWCVMCMHAVVNHALQLWSNVALMVVMYVGELTGHKVLKSTCSIEQISPSFCFLLVDLLDHMIIYIIRFGIM